MTIGYGVMGAGVGLMLGGDAVVTAVAFVAAVAIDLTQRRLTRYRLPSFYQQIAGGMVATLIASAVAATGVDANPSKVVTASIILLLAGVNFMGAIQDALIGYPLTASARILEAMLATAGVIAGVSGGLSLARVLHIDFGPLNPGAFSLSDIPLMAFGGAITAGAFAFASYAPLRSLLPIALTGAAATTLYGLVLERELGVAWAAAAGALLVGMVSYSVAGRVRVPALIIVVSGVVPLLPGLSIFRGLARLAEGSEAGLLSMVNAAAVAIALSSGVFLGEYIARPLKREARRLEGRLAGPRLVGPFHVRTTRKRKTPN